MTISIRPSTPEFAGEVSGVDLTRPVCDDTIAAIEAGMDRYAVLVFRDQAFNDDTQRAFTRRFGPLEAAAGGHVTLSGSERAMFEPVRHRLVRTHPVTGRAALFRSAHAGTIAGWPVPDGRAFPRDLTEHATRRRLVYAHARRRNDLVMWDNRRTMHRVTRFDETRPRDLRRTTVAGIAA